jgi:hypothetical protein
MMRRFPLFCVVVLLLVGWGIGCRAAARTTSSSKVTLPREARPAPRVGLPAEEIKQAARLCTNKCLRCHKLYDPAQYSDTEWRSWMTKMSKKAHLQPDQEDLLSRYLGAFRTAN